MERVITGVHHVAIKCANQEQYDKALEFYGITLRLPMVREWGEGPDAGAMFHTGDNSVMEIFASGAVSNQTGSVNHFALATKEVDAIVEEVRKAGYEITMEPNNIVIPSAQPMHARIAFCKGPAGEEIEFFDEK